MSSVNNVKTEHTQALRRPQQQEQTRTDNGNKYFPADSMSGSPFYPHSSNHSLFKKRQWKSHRHMDGARLFINMEPTGAGYFRNVIVRGIT